jgi:hypothetical protein
VIVVEERPHSAHRLGLCEIRLFLGLTKRKTGLPSARYFLALAQELTAFACTIRTLRMGSPSPKQEDRPDEHDCEQGPYH